MACARISKWIGPGLALVALLVTATWSSFVRAEKITVGGLSVDIDPGSNGVCVVLPESLYDPSNCADFNVAGERQKFATLQGTARPVAVMHVREGEATHHVLVLHDRDLRTEFDKDMARDFARGARDKVRAQWKVELTPDAQLEPTEVRVQGVQVTGFDATPALPADHPQRVQSYTLLFAAATDHGAYVFTFAGAPENAAAVSALASRSLATLQAKPAPPPAPKARSLAYQLGRAMGSLGMFGLLAFFLVRALLNKGTPKPNPPYGYNPPPQDRP